MDRDEMQKQVDQRRQELAEARAAMPYHSVRPWQLERLEQAEEALAHAEHLLAQADGPGDQA